MISMCYSVNSILIKRLLYRYKHYSFTKIAFQTFQITVDLLTQVYFVIRLLHGVLYTKRTDKTTLWYRFNLNWPTFQQPPIGTRRKRHFIAEENVKWPNKVIPYQIETSTFNSRKWANQRCSLHVIWRYSCIILLFQIVCPSISLSCLIYHFSDPDIGSLYLTQLTWCCCDFDKGKDRRVLVLIANI